MPISSSSIKPITQGFKVLLVESDKKSLQHHAYVLLQNSYRVISTMKISEALSMIISKNTYDCVLIDAENHDMDLVDFLQTIWSHQPELRIIVMTSNESHMQVARETLPNDTIWFIRKPCGGSIICNMLQHICKKRLAFGEGVSLGKNQGPSTVFNMITSSSTNNGLNMINSHKYEALFNPTAYVDVSSDDDDDNNNVTKNKNICIGTTENKDKGKHPMELKRDINLQNNTRNNNIIAWTPAIHEKFLEAPAVLSKEGAYPSEILKHMNVPRLTQTQVASHLQRIQERVTEKENGCKRCEDNKALVYNSNGLSWMSLDNIRSKLQEAGPPLINNNDVTNKYCYGGGDQLIDDGTNANNIFPNAFGNDSAGGLAQFDRFGIPVDSTFSLSAIIEHNQ